MESAGLEPGGLRFIVSINQAPESVWFQNNFKFGINYGT